MYMKKMLYILDYMLILIHQLRQAYHTEYVRRCKAMQKYQLKAELYWRLSNKDTLHLYATNANLIRRIDTENPQKLFSFLQFLSEWRTEAEILGYAHLDENDIAEIMKYLKQQNYLHLNNPIPDYMSRINSFITCFPTKNLSDYLDKLNTTQVLIIGLGTAGSYQLDLLSKIGIKNFILIDGDKVEEKNLGAQNFFYDDVGKYKASVLKSRYHSKFIHIQAINRQVDSYKQLTRLVDLSKVNYLINCADDSKLCLDILTNLFTEKNDIQLFINGYSILQQISIKICQKKYLEITNQLKTSLNNEKDTLNISCNSGSVYNAYFSALSIGKMIADDLFQLSDKNYAIGDFYTNQYRLLTLGKEQFAQ